MLENNSVTFVIYFFTTVFVNFVLFSPVIVELNGRSYMHVNMGLHQSLHEYGILVTMVIFLSDCL